MNTSFEKTFLGWVQTYFRDAMRSEFTQQHSASLDFFKNMKTGSYVEVMIGPFNQTAYGNVFKKWIRATERKWSPHEMAELGNTSKPKLNPKDTKFIGRLLNRLKEEIYLLYESGTIGSRGGRIIFKTS